MEQTSEDIRRTLRLAGHRAYGALKKSAHDIAGESWQLYAMRHGPSATTRSNCEPINDQRVVSMLTHQPRVEYASLELVHRHIGEITPGDIVETNAENIRG